MIRQLILAVVLLLGICSVQAAGSININTADVATLEHELKGIGNQKAQAIVEYREVHGPYGSIEELANVKGIGEKTLEAIRDQITVSDGENSQN